MKRIFTLLVCLLVLLSAHSQQAGTLDSSFAKKGWRYIDFVKGNNYPEAAKKVFLQEDGKYVLLINTADGWKLVRYFFNGKLDKTYGKDGYHDLQKNVNLAGQQADGKIVVVSGFLDTNYINRYNLDGTCDSSFGRNGMTRDTIHNFYEGALTFQEDGKIIVAGTFLDTNNNYNFLLSRYNQDGSLDKSFGKEGRAITKAGEIVSLTVQNDRRLIAVGNAYPERHSSIVCYTENGSIDSSFGDNGIVLTSLGVEGDYCYTVAVDDRGKIVIAGNTGAYFGLSRYNKNGSLDRTFGEKGYAKAIFPKAAATVYHLSIEDDGTITAAGIAEYSGNVLHFALARFQLDGSLDKSFGEEGKVVTILSEPPVKEDDQEPTSLLVQKDGKILLTGFTSTLSTKHFSDYVLVRYTTHGALDNSFNGDGKVIGYYPASDSFVDAGSIQEDGKIVAAGSSFYGKNRVDEKNLQQHFDLSRYNSEGVLDKSFGKNGIATIDFPQDHEFIKAIAIQNEGKILAVGNAYDFEDDWYLNYYIALARFNKDGSVDNSFGDSGKIIIKTPGVNENNRAYAITVQSDGKILLVGTMNDMDDHFSLIRFNENGTVDYSFGKRGKVKLPSELSLYSIALQKDGKIVAAGAERNASSHYSFAVVRFNPNGSLDKSFGHKGKTVTSIKHEAKVYSIIIQTDGKIVTGGTVFDLEGNADFTLARYNVNGSLDKSFGNKGKVITDFGIDDKINSITLQADGKIIATGYTQYRLTGLALYKSVALARYQTNGSLDSSFGNNGKISSAFTKTCEAYFAGIYKNKLYVVGSSSENYFYRGILATYNLGCASQQTFYKDNDGDGYGDLNKKLWACTAPRDYVADSTDCNDNNASVHPGAKEICGNKIDDNCDGQIDEGCSSSPFLTMHNVTVSANGRANLSVSLSKKSDKPVYIFYFTADGTASGLPWREDKDYEAKAGVLVIPSGSQNATVSVKIIKDNLKEGDEYFYVYLLGSFNATIEDQKAKITIKDETETSTLSPLVADALKNKELPEENFDVKAYPNPSAYSFTIETKSTINTPITIRIIDATGRVVEVMSNIATNSTINVGQNYLPGIYYAEVLYGKKKTVMKLIKQSK